MDKTQIRIYAALILFIICFGGCTVINKYIGQKDDWFGEELLEEVIEAKLGIDLDLTPETPEK